MADCTNFLVEHCDIPEGMTLTQWRCAQARQRAADQRAAAEQRKNARRRTLTRLLTFGTRKPAAA